MHLHEFETNLCEPLRASANLFNLYEPLSPRKLCADDRLREPVS